MLDGNVNMGWETVYSKIVTSTIILNLYFSSFYSFNVVSNHSFFVTPFETGDLFSIFGSILNFLKTIVSSFSTRNNSSSILFKEVSLLVSKKFIYKVINQL